MTRTAPTTAAPPSARSLRQWAIAATQSLVSLALGLVMLLIVFGVVLTEFDDDPPGGLVAMYGVDAVLGILATMVIGPLRFLRPGTLHTVAHLLMAATAGFSTWSLPAAAIALYRLGSRRRVWLDVAAVVLITTTSTVTVLVDTALSGDTVSGYVLASVAVMAAGVLIPLLMGHVVGTRHELMETLRDRAAAAERESAAVMRERDADGARVRAEERAALARDMHDSISHHLAAIALHAGAMSYRDDLPPEELRRAARTVRDAAQQANRELRTVLMTLRTTGGDAPLATAPTLGDIVERCREEGQDVELSWDGISPAELSERDRSTVVTLARILREVTTNAAKHAPDAPLRVRLTRQDDRVLLSARNPLPATVPDFSPSTGHGLLGVQERARLLGGDARHGDAGNDFEVEAWMPW